MDDKIKQWIKENLDKGYSLESIKQKIKESNYDTKLVNEVINSQMPPSPPIKKSEPQASSDISKTEMNLFQRTKKILFSPKEYFEEIKSERDFRTPLTFYLMFVFTSSILMSIVLLNTLNTLTFTNLIIDIASKIISYILLLVLIHIFVSILGGKEGFINTFKAVIYPSILVPIIIISQIIILLILPSISFFLTFIMLGIGLYALQLELWAFERLQNLTQWKSFFAIILSAAILSIAITFLGLTFKLV